MNQGGIAGDDVNQWGSSRRQHEPVGQQPATTGAAAGDNMNQGGAAGDNVNQGEAAGDNMNQGGRCRQQLEPVGQQTATAVRQQQATTEAAAGNDVNQWGSSSQRREPGGQALETIIGQCTLREPTQLEVGKSYLLNVRVRQHGTTKYIIPTKDTTVQEIDGDLHTLQNTDNINISSPTTAQVQQAKYRVQAQRETGKTDWKRSITSARSLIQRLKLQNEERHRQAKFVQQAIEKDERNYPIAQVEIRVGHRSYVQGQRKGDTEPAAPCYHRNRCSSPGRPGAATGGMDTSQSMTEAPRLTKLALQRKVREKELEIGKMVVKNFSLEKELEARDRTQKEEEKKELLQKKEAKVKQRVITLNVKSWREKLKRRDFKIRKQQQKLDMMADTKSELKELKKGKGKESRQLVYWKRRSRVLDEGLKAREYHITINPNAKPVVQPPRRVPLELRDRLKAQLQEMEEGIISEVTQPTDWVNSIAVKEKSNGKLYKFNRLPLGLKVIQDVFQREIDDAYRNYRDPAEVVEVSTQTDSNVCGYIINPLLPNLDEVPVTIICTPVSEATSSQREAILQDISDIGGPTSILPTGRQFAKPF
ncbi:hypothetical protein Bbelb_035920 [Branchiostoma belcheri]|nr:hypothetical protein Bbelb_035920 [Branchiostoma belcheri]